MGMWQRVLPITASPVTLFDPSGSAFVCFLYWGFASGSV